MQPVQVITFGLLLALVTLSDADCNYFQELESGQSYYVYNEQYPANYGGGESCSWQTTSPEVIKINCSIEMPLSNNCVEDSLTITFVGQKSQQYCGYGNVVLRGKNVTINMVSSVNSNGGRILCHMQTEHFDEYNCQCGWTNPTRIVGGSETGVNEFPLMAGLVDVFERNLYCGATIISDQYVLTAAHCVFERNVDDIGVVVGEHDTSTGRETSATRIYRISKYTIHPYYDQNDNDIAICKVTERITFSLKVGPVCLPFQHQYDSFIGSYVTILGWGQLEFGGTKSNTLQKVTVSVTNKSYCAKYYPNITRQHLCTYAKEKDACQMDSGGPVLWENPTTRNRVLAGIISGGIGCGSDAPAVNMRVGEFIKWIVSETPDVQYCKVE